MGKMTTELEVKNKVAIRTDITLPPQFKVIFINDNVTTMEFVLESLITFFGYNFFVRVLTKTNLLCIIPIP